MGDSSGVRSKQPGPADRHTRRRYRRSRRSWNELALLPADQGLRYRFCQKPLPGCAAALPDEHRSEEHTSELQSRLHLVCRLLLEKKKKKEHTAYGVRGPALGDYAWGGVGGR